MITTGLPEKSVHEPGADQSHIVIERQPADGYVVGHDSEPLDNRPDIREQVRVRQRDALGIAGRPGRVLQERDIFAARLMRKIFDGPPAVRARAVVRRLHCKPLRVQDSLERGDARLQEPRRIPRPGGT